MIRVYLVFWYFEINKKLNNNDSFVNISKFWKGYEKFMAE